MRGKFMDLKKKVIIGLLCSILGVTISLQYNTIKKITEEELSPTLKSENLAIELKNLRAEKEKLNQELTNLERHLKEYEISEADENLVIKNLKSELEQYQILAGYKEVEGPGIVITVDDPPENDFIAGGGESIIMYHYYLILKLINNLNASGAKAISINDQRYISITGLHDKFNTIVINSVPTRPPFTIKAIGNTETMERALNIRYGIAWVMRQQYNLKVNVKKENSISIPAYNNVIKYEYAKPIESIQ